MTASEEELGALHKQVAEALTEQVQGYDEPLIKDGEVVGTRRVRASPAVLGAAIAFLKNNEITASPSNDAGLRELRDKLAQRRRSGSKLSQQALDDAAEAFARQAGLQ